MMSLLEGILSRLKNMKEGNEDSEIFRAERSPYMQCELFSKPIPSN